jgi:hypothetical protein
MAPLLKPLLKRLFGWDSLSRQFPTHAPRPALYHDGPSRPAIMRALSTADVYQAVVRPKSDSTAVVKRKRLRLVQDKRRRA